MDDWVTGRTYFQLRDGYGNVFQVISSDVIEDENDPIVNDVLDYLAKDEKAYVNIIAIVHKPMAFKEEDYLKFDLTERYNALLEKEGK